MAPTFKILKGHDGAWHWQLIYAAPETRTLNGPFLGRLSREEVEAEVTEAAKAMQVAAKAWLAEHPEAA